MRRRSGRGGSRKFSVPNLNGLTRSQAIAAIQAAGFTYSESQQETSTSGLNLFISQQSVSAGTVIPLGSTVPFIYYNYVEPAPVITYGPCETYGSPIQNLGNSTGCSGNFYQERTTYRYNTRKKIYSNGSWDGSSYSTDGCGTTDVLTVTSSNQIDGLCGYTAPPPACTITSYSAWSYGNITWSGNCPSGTESGTAASRSRTDNCGNTYNESGSYSVTRSCTPPSTTTYGACQAYGDAISGPVSSRTTCDGNYTVGYQTWTYAARRTILINGSWDGYSYDYGCGNVNQEILVSYQQINGSCGFTTPPPSVTYYCTESFNGAGVGNCTYTTSSTDTSYSNTSYSSRSCSTSGYPSCLSTNPAPTCTSYKYNCKSYDVTNPASNNYFQCYTVGECAANNNSDGSRTTCCASYG